MKNNVVLWQQSATSTGDSILSHNKEIISPDNECYQLLFDSIFDDNNEDVTLYKDEQLQIYKRQKSYLIFSNFEEKDESNRRIAFAVRIDAKSRSEVLTLLQEEISWLKKSISQRKASIIKIALFRKEIVALIGMLLVITICSTLICRLK